MVFHLFSHPMLGVLIREQHTDYTQAGFPVLRNFRSGFHSCSVHSSLQFHSRSSSGVVLKIVRAPGNTLGDNSGDRATEPVVGNALRQGCKNTWGLAGLWKIMNFRRTFLLISEIHRVIFKTENNKI